MKRNWELIREILIKIEEDSNICANLKEEDEKKYLYHIELLIEEGLIKGNVILLLNEKRCKIDKLTWKGHDFLAAIKEDTIWNKTKSLIERKALNISFDTIIKIADGII